MKEEDKILLKAILAPNKSEAESNYNKWSANVDLSKLSQATVLLLPQLTVEHNNNKFKEIRRHTWYKNSLLLQRIEEISQAFNGNKIFYIVLKGASLILTAYKDLSLRPMGDGDILIKPDDLEQAQKILRDLGFVPKFTVKTQLLASHAVVFKDTRYAKELEIEIDLHISFLNRRYLSKYDSDLWNNTQIILSKNIPITILDSTTLLFHILVHSYEWDFQRSFLWITDSIKIITNNQIDWDKLIELSVKYDSILEVKIALKLLAKEFKISIPDIFINTLGKQKLSLMAKAEFMCKNYSFGFFKNFILAYIAYWRSENKKGFILFIKSRWGVDSLIDVPLHGLKEYTRKISKR